MDGENASLAVTLALYVGLPAAVLFVGWLAGHLSETKRLKVLFREGMSLPRKAYVIFVCIVYLFI